MKESFQHFTIGGVAGAAGVTVVYPIDLVKTRMQNQNNTALYRNSVHCFRSIVRNEGLKGVYSGLKPQLIGVSPEKAIKLTVNDGIRRLCKYTDTQITLPVEIAAGAAAGASQVVVTNPLEIVKIKLQIDGELPKEKRTTATNIVRSLGIRGLYKGSVSCFARDIPFSAIYFPLYEHLKLEWVEGKPTPFQLFQCGTVSGVFAAAATTPMDVIKTRVQARIELTDGAKSISMLNATNNLIKNEGYLGLFKGIIPRVLRSAPQFGVTLLVYELLKNTLSD